VNPTALLRGTGLRILHAAGSEEATAWASAGEDGVVDAGPVRRVDGRKRRQGVGDHGAEGKGGGSVISRGKRK